MSVIFNVFRVDPNHNLNDPRCSQVTSYEHCLLTKLIVISRYLIKLSRNNRLGIPSLSGWVRRPIILQTVCIVFFTRKVYLLLTHWRNQLLSRSPLNAKLINYKEFPREPLCLHLLVKRKRLLYLVLHANLKKCVAFNGHQLWTYMNLHSPARVWACLLRWHPDTLTTFMMVLVGRTCPSGLNPTKRGKPFWYSTLYQ